MLPWLGAYVALLAAWALIITRRSHPTLWKGSSLFVVNALFVIATIVYGVVNTKSSVTGVAIVLPRSVIVLDVVLMLLALWLHNKWLLIGVSHTEAAQILERCFHQTRSAATRRTDDYVVKCGDLEMIAGISPNRVAIGNLHLHLPGHTIRFSGARASKKAKLIRSLFSKQFGGSFPTPRIKA